MDTVTGNKLIAEWMEKQLYDDKPFMPSSMQTKGLEYHSSWSWLMPVVEKMSTIHYGWKDMETPYDDCAYPRTFGMLNAEGKPMVRFNSSQLFTGDTLIEATWLAVVDFVQWYNTLPHNPTKPQQL